MDMVNVFRMNGGIGDTSYSNNSTGQRTGIAMAKEIIEQALRDFCCSSSNFPKTITVADLGCSSGPNTLVVSSILINTIAKISLDMGHASPEIQLYLNDLPSNDFNNIFISLQKFQENLATQKFVDAHSPPPCYFFGAPGSFYNRLFPAKFLHFVHSNHSLHWLSQTPEFEEINKGAIYLSSTTPQSVSRAYHEQFAKDFLEFLRCRSEEMTDKGCMVLTLWGRRSDNCCDNESRFVMDYLAMALNDMVHEGIIDEEKLDSFNIPLYMVSTTEIKNLVEKEGSFAINRLEILDVRLKDLHTNNESGEKDINYETLKESHTRGHRMAMSVRAVFESLVVDHFGSAIVDEVFMRYEKILIERMPTENDVIAFITISLTKIG